VIDDVLLLLCLSTPPRRHARKLQFLIQQPPAQARQEGEKRRAKEDNAKCIAEEEARNKPLHTDEDYWGHTPGDDTFYIED